MVVPLFLLSLPLARAQLATGIKDFAIDSSTPIFDLSSEAAISAVVTQADGEPADIFFTVTIVNDATGQLRGSSLTILQIGEDLVAANYSLKGTIRRNHDETRAVILVKLSGQGVIAGQDVRFKMTVLFDGTIDPFTSEWIGTVKTTVKFSDGLGKGRGTLEDSVAVLSNGTDGSWFLTLDLNPVRPGGTAVITLSTGREMQFNANGKFQGDTTTLKASGDGASKGSSMKIFIVAGSDLAAIDGIVLGQKISFVPSFPDEEDPGSE